jgi:hypothetical protein
MAHAEKIKLRAFYLYLTGDAGSWEEIARRIRAEFGTKTGGVTIARWAEEPDDHGETWEDRRRAIAAKLRTEAETEARDRLSEIQDESRQIGDRLRDQIMAEAAPKIKDLPSAIYALRHIREFEMLMDQKRTGKMSPVMVVQMLLQTFQEIPEIRNPIQKHWNRVMDAVQTRLLEAPNGEES